MRNFKIEFIETANKLKLNGLVSEGVNKGSISCRLTDDSFLVSPSKLNYSQLTEKNINIMKTDGSFLDKPLKASRDSYFHLGIYKTYPDVQAVIHTHSRYATALSLANKSIPFITVGMKFHCGGKVDIAPYAPPNSDECNHLILEHLKDRKAVLLQNHGLVCVGDTLKDCYQNVEFVESLSESYLHALLLGEVRELDMRKEGYIERV